MKLQIKTNRYNPSRHGKPWIAIVYFDKKDGTARFKFGNWLGVSGFSGILEIIVKHGDIIARGQKDYQNSINSSPDFYLVTHKAVAEVEGLMIDNGFEPITHKQAFEKYLELQTISNLHGYTELKNEFLAVLDDYAESNDIRIGDIDIDTAAILFHDHFTAEFNGKYGSILGHWPANRETAAYVLVYAEINGLSEPGLRILRDHGLDV